MAPPTADAWLGDLRGCLCEWGEGKPPPPSSVQHDTRECRLGRGLSGTFGLASLPWHWVSAQPTRTHQWFCFALLSFWWKSWLWGCLPHLYFGGVLKKKWKKEKPSLKTTFFLLFDFPVFEPVCNLVLLSYWWRLIIFTNNFLFPWGKSADSIHF